MKKYHKKEESSQKVLSPSLEDGALDRILGELRRKTLRISPSETMSLYSDNPEGELFLGGLKRLTSREALALVLCFDKEDPVWWYLREKILDDCYRYKYKGNWRLVQKLLMINDDNLLLRRFLEDHSSQEIFGNLLVLANKRISKMQIHKRYTPVKLPQRKRGYNDHGSRRDDSKWLPDRVHLGPNPKRQDLRNGVAKTLKEKVLRFLWS